MVLFPNCKINIGLDILSRRTDGFHELSTVMYPLKGLCDALEIVRLTDNSADLRFTTSGITVDCDPEQNICVKAFRLMQLEFGVTGIGIHLQKAIPFGAGLGGGSADAAFAIRGINTLYNIGLSVDQMETLAAKLGSDTAFFVKNRPALATSRGEILQDIDIQLGGRYIVILKPTVSVSTAEAYAGVSPKQPNAPLQQRLGQAIEKWRETVTNHFEPHIFEMYPQIAELKSMLYRSGALYASMSGSGSAVYGIFNLKPTLNDLYLQNIVYQGVAE